jgi:two-component sensor histidine kinase
LRLQAASAPDQQSRQILEAAGSRVMVIGKIERLLSHAESTGMVDLKAFINALVNDMRSTLVDPDKIDIRVVADNAVLPVSKAVVLGALLAEVINNALKHAFPRGMSGVLAVRLVASNDHYLVEVEDDGVGIDRSRTRDGFGMRTIAELARLMHGSVTSQDARKSDARPGTIWKLVVPRGAAV